MQMNKIAYFQAKDIDSLQKKVYEFLRESMHSGMLLPGSIINLNQISQELGISKTPLRDALIRMESEGYVTIYPRRGVVVNRLGLEDIRFLYEVVGALEAAIIPTIMDRFDDLQMKRLHELTSDMRMAIENEDPLSYQELHWEFHDMFMKLSGNVFAERVLSPIKHRLWDFPRRRFWKDWELTACVEHEKIVEGICKGDTQKVLEVIRESHWNFELNKEYIQWVYFF